MMRPAELRRPPVAKRGKGQVREGLRYVRTVPDLWIPLVMMAIIGTLAFNFQVVLPLFVDPHVRRRRRHVHAAVVGHQRRVADRRAGDGPAQDRSSCAT